MRRGNTERGVAIAAPKYGVANTPVEIALGGLLLDTFKDGKEASAQIGRIGVALVE